MSGREAMVRSRAKQVYGPLQDKSLRSILIKKLIEEYGYSDKLRIAETLVDDFLDTIDALSPARGRLKPGQMVWIAVAKGERHGYGKRMGDVKQVPVVLTVVSDEDLAEYASGEKPKEIRKARVVRMVREAKGQGGVLAQSDLAVILGYSNSNVSMHLREYQEGGKAMLPTRGVVHDMGRGTTHKARIVELYLKGYSTLDIARMTDHEPNNVDRYVQGYEIVRALADKTSEEISYVAKMSPSLVGEYLEIMRKHDKEAVTK